MRDRVILHSDLNYFYAQVECKRNPQLKRFPIAVAGKEKLRHGVVLAKNPLAKQYGITTGETLHSARLKCPSLVVVPPHFSDYVRVAHAVRKIYYDYTHQVEPFGLDEAWLDVTGSLDCLHMKPYEVAQDIARRIKEELGLTVSIGISWNKIFAKFGSDYKKPDAITQITRNNYTKLVWDAPVQDLLYVGRKTKKKLYKRGITTIGELARTPKEELRQVLGKPGLTLSAFARGEDASPVHALNPLHNDSARKVKSFGNGTTFPRDIVDDKTAQAVLWALAESVAHRLRAAGVRGKTVSVAWRDSATLKSQSHQGRLPLPTQSTHEIACFAWELLHEAKVFSAEHAVRSLHVTVSGLVSAKQEQGVLFEPYKQHQKYERLDGAIDNLRSRFGNNCVVWGPKTRDGNAWLMDPKRDNTIHPEGYFSAQSAK